jgi:hypothetical protein
VQIKLGKKRELMKRETEATTNRQTTQFLDSMIMMMMKKKKKMMMMMMMMMILSLTVTAAERVSIILIKLWHIYGCVRHPGMVGCRYSSTHSLRGKSHRNKLGKTSGGFQSLSETFGRKETSAAGKTGGLFVFLVHTGSSSGSNSTNSSSSEW